MRIESVQTGRVRDLPAGGSTITTGIDKRPVATVTANADGVEGDAIVSTEHHGGPDQAVYLYARSDYRVFEEELGQTLDGGSFGENVTVDAWPHDPIRIGDRFDFDGVVLEVTCPRIPCATFAARMAEITGDRVPGWVKRFAAERRPGWYCRVLAPGSLSPGQEAAATRAPDTNITGLEMMDLYYDPSPPPAALQRALASPIAARSRAAWAA